MKQIYLVFFRGSHTKRQV